MRGIDSQGIGSRDIGFWGIGLKEPQDEKVLYKQVLYNLFNF